jgi:3-hydroxybutyryl-CoA dehydratase
MGVAAQESSMSESPVSPGKINLAVGTDLPPYAIAAVQPQSMQQWAVFLRDPNPIHLDPVAVQAKGLGHRVINQGPANLGVVITMIQQAFPGSILESLEVRYVGSVFGGDSVEAGGRISEVCAGHFGPHVTCEVWLRANERDIVISGTAVLSPSPSGET